MRQMDQGIDRSLKPEFRLNVGRFKNHQKNRVSLRLNFNQFEYRINYSKKKVVCKSSLHSRVRFLLF